MKKESIKAHLKQYSIHGRRRTTLNHAFASAIAPNDRYEEGSIEAALEFLGQSPNSELSCVFCGKEAETWDHLVGLVKKGDLRGLGHQIGNLVPCCKKCNSEKGGKDLALFVDQSSRIRGDRAILVKKLTDYMAKFAKPIDLSLLKETQPDAWARYQDLKATIFDLMHEADQVAAVLRNHVVKK